jgi:hypothetical protein
LEGVKRASDGLLASRVAIWKRYLVSLRPEWLVVLKERLQSID